MILSCFNISGNLYYNEIGFSRPYVTEEDPVQTMVDLILEETDEWGPTAPVYFVGHSWGGWLAMQVVKQLGDRVKVGGLITVDPISPDYCSISDYLSAIADWGMGDAIAGCLVAPPDVAPSFRASLVRILGRNWFHYYQLDFPFLHSTAFDGAHQPAGSFDMSSFLSIFPGGSRASMFAHAEIAFLSAVWTTAEQLMLNDLGLE